MKIKLSLGLITALFIIGCGSGSSEGNNNTGGDSNSTTPTSSDRILVATGNSSGSTQIKGSNGIYYDTYGCRTNGLASVQYAFYNDGLVQAEYLWKGTVYPSVCFVASAYEHIELSNTTDVDGAYVNKSTFYDNTTKKYYKMTRYSESSDDQLVEITNDGLNAIIKKVNNDTYLLEIAEAYKKIDLSTTGIQKYEPSSDYYTGNADDIMETGYKSSFTTSNKPYDFIGYLYNYEHSGCMGDGLHITYYEIYNDGLMHTLRDDGTTSSCVITAFYERIKQNATDVDGAYVNQSTFYDNNSKIYYNMVSFSESSSDRLVEVINDGNNAIIQRSGGDTYLLEISSAFKRIAK